MIDFGFTEWPFTVIPSEERGAELWADRKSTLHMIENILQDWSVNKDSNITLLWADLGAGKTHTLYNLQARVRVLERMLPIYVLLPQTISKFIDLYQAIAKVLDWDEITDKLPEKITPLIGKSLRQVLKWFCSDVDQVRKNLALRWVLASRLRPKECEMLGVPQPLSDPDDAVQILAIALQALSSPDRRIILMIDEYQRVAEGSRRQLQQIGHGVHTLFNACPRNFSLILSCATGMSDDYNMFLTPEIASRMSAKRIELPCLTAIEIIDYVKDLFNHYRREKAPNNNVFFPLTDLTTRAMAQYLIEGFGEKEVTPRLVNEAFAELLSFIRKNELPCPISQEQLRTWIGEYGQALIKSLRQ
jgi:Cdc6-like AAA superfamily ATPase